MLQMRAVDFKSFILFYFINLLHLFNLFRTFEIVNKFSNLGFMQ